MNEIVNQDRVQGLYINDVASGESHFEGRMVLRLPRAFGFQIYTWDVNPEVLPPGDRPPRGPIEYASALAWNLYNVVDTELVIASNNQSAPMVKEIVDSMHEQAGQEELRGVWTYATGSHYPGSIAMSYIRGYKLARFIQKKTASLQ